jgi:putative membrane protein
MKCILPAICCLTFFSLPVLAQKAAPMSDQKFLDFAAQTDMVEAHLGKLAQDSAGKQPVKDYAQMLVHDHTQDFGKLQTLATQTSLTMPNAIDAAHNKSMVGPFHSLKGSAFDHKYIQDMIAGHTQALATYKKEAHDAQNPEVRAYAEETIPTLQKHLDGAKALQQGKSPAM